MQYRNLARDWIEPEPDLQLEYGQIEGVFVSYLQINPEFPEKPYRLKRDYIPKHYAKGTVFVRRGSASVIVPHDETDSLLPARKVAYLKRSDWKEIVERAKFGSQRFYDLLMTSPLYDTSGNPVFDTVLEHLQRGDNLIALVGNAGQGKTTVVNALAWELARRVNFDGLRKHFGDAEISNDLLSVAEDLEVIPPVPVPVKMELRKAFTDIAMFEKELLLSMLGSIPDGKRLEHFWNIPGSHWVLLLDGLDELNDWKVFAERLQIWIGQLPKNVQVVISSRPYAIGEISTGVRLAPLNRDQVFTVLRRRLFDETPETAQENYTAIQSYLNTEPGIFDIFVTPRAVDGFLNFWLKNFKPALMESDKTPIRVVHESSVNIVPNAPSQIQAAISGINQDELADTDSTVSLFSGERTPDAAEKPPEDSSLPVAIALASIADHVYIEEQKRQNGRWGNDAVNALEDAQEALQKTAWRKDWADETFKKRLMEDKLRELNEHIGLISRSDVKCRYRYRSLFFQSFCAARYAVEYLDEKDDKILQQLTNRIRIPATAQVLKLLNQLRGANNRPQLSISEGGSQ